MPARPPLAVVGSGPSGLAAAFRLQQAGHRVRIFEADDRLGGKLRTIYRDGFVIDEGASVFPDCYHSLLSIVRDAGLGDEVVPSGSVMAFARDGKIHRLDSNHVVRDALRLGLVSARTKLRMVKILPDILRVRKLVGLPDLAAADTLDDESARDYAKRLLDDEALQYLVEPVIRSLSGVGAEQAPKIDFLFSLAKFVVGVRFLAFRGGMSSYADLLGRRFDIERSARVTSVYETVEGVELLWSGPDGREHREKAAGCVIALPAMLTADIHRDLDIARREYLRRLRYTTGLTVSIALSRAPAEVATYIQIPASVHPGLSGVVLEHNKHPGRVPAGKGLIGFYTTWQWAQELEDLPDDEVVKQVMVAAAGILPDLERDFLFANVGRWAPMSPLRGLGDYADLRRFVEGCRGDRLIQLAGDYFGFSNMDTASAAGQRAAKELIGRLNSPGEEVRHGHHQPEA